MCQLELEKELGRRNLEGRKLSWVLKLWHIREAHIPPAISKNQNVWAFLKIMTGQKASQKYRNVFVLQTES